MNNRLAWMMAVMALAVTQMATAETYRWIDSDGKPHYSDTPISGAQPVTVKGPGVNADGSESSTPDPAKEQAAKDETTVRAEQCDQATARLKTYKESGSLYQQDEYGRRQEIAGDERVKLIVKAQHDVKDFCGETQAAQ